MRAVGIILVLFGLMTIQARPAGAETPCLKLVAHETGIVSTISKNVRLALNEAGLCSLFYNPLSAETQKAKEQGLIDGELLRVQFYDRLIGERLVIVPTPLASGNGFVVVRKESDITKANYKDYKIGYLVGTIWNKLVVKKMKNAVVYENYQQLVTALKLNEIDGFLADSVAYMSLKKKLGQARPLAIMNLSGHTWLLAKHKDLAVKVNQAYMAYLAKGRAFTDPIQADHNH
ncbi:exported hypothetical protein [Candidatus Terasakiella magnetica]|uniref:Uncharacterized protein n=1 Tax=Candidatus Terasakiella magnetica TaxID=1867952 RepID=A0A1C3RLE1_9PROT|nr:transporter substrate-binding domain-containing protein [Candidatus Terasakiella magnetica]SCA58058.1 exported hypothetical protein [Candidatus Terasakiella magnetica]